MPIDTLSAAALVLASLATGPVLAQQNYPSRTITIIAPFSPGTGIDILARTCGQKLSERWGVPVIVDNKPGASGNIGTELAAQAAGDGYTLMMTATTFALNPALSKKARYDPLKSFAPVSLVAEATRDLAGGYVDAMILPVHTVAPLVHAGKVRLLAVLNDERSPVFPAVPTLKEAGYPEVESSVWYGLMAPASTPADIVRRLNGEIGAILALADVKEILAKQGLSPAGGEPERLSRLVGTELQRWRRVIAEAKIRAD